jgi:hypothetical protein
VVNEVAGTSFQAEGVSIQCVKMVTQQYLEAIMTGDKLSDVFLALEGCKFSQPVDKSVLRLFEDVKKVIAAENFPPMNISEYRKVLLEHASKFYRLHPNVKGVYTLPCKKSSSSEKWPMTPEHI